jgi:hypothetical protein
VNNEYYELEWYDGSYSSYLLYTPPGYQRRR